MSGKRHLPRITRVELTDFSLYRNMRSLDVPLQPSGVFCLAGANGLGKSSFLSAINFGLTGIVAAPARNFLDVDQYYSDSIEYSRRYFDGRIEELDHATAQVGLSFAVSGTQYRIVRSLFDPTGLRELAITQADGTSLYSEPEEGTDDQARHDAFASRIVIDCNLGNFAQFVFMQHFLLSFDERRHLIFWDEAVTEPALYLAFGLDANDTVVATSLRKRIRKAESDARNAQWQATQASNRMRDLGVEPDALDALGDLVETHQRLVHNLDETTANVIERQQAMDDARLQAAEASAKQSAVRMRYDEVFQSRRAQVHDPAQHPIVRASLTQGKCEVCGTSGPEVTHRIRESLDHRSCPLCASALDRAFDDESATELRKLDEQLADAAEQFSAASTRVRRLEGELNAATALQSGAQVELAEFETLHAKRLPGLQTASGSLVERGTQLTLEKESAQRRRDEYRVLRDNLRAQLRPIQEKLGAAYREAELEFVPSFRSLAHKFIGLDLDIFLESREATGFALGLEVEGIRRRATTQLSESQRFFLDIALRMALAEHMTATGEGTSLIVDTPEGSLDIAYEARAGDMFADFVERGNQIVMTANINASQLLKRLASRCTESQMELVRMTEWAPLSEVQASEEDLFDQAFEAIERALVPGAEKA